MRASKESGADWTWDKDDYLIKDIRDLVADSAPVQQKTKKMQHQSLSKFEKDGNHERSAKRSSLNGNISERSLMSHRVDNNLLSPSKERH